MKPAGHKRPQAAAAKRWATALAWLCVAACCGAARAADGTATLLLSIARQGTVLLAVGERGAIRRSTDNGAHWASIAAPTHATLTRVISNQDGTAYAVGFDATILRSGDDGAHWARMYNDERGDNPLFGIAVQPAGGLAIGGFARAYASPDGRAWHHTDIPTGDDDFHLNALLTATPLQWLLVGEAGLAMVSADAGLHWARLTVPVQGSLFGGVIAAPTRWVVFGLRGHVAATEDAGAHWHSIDSGVTAELLGGTMLPDGRVLLVGNRGTAVLIGADLQRARALKLATRDNFADCVAAQDGTVWTVGDAGLAPLPVPQAGATW